MRYALPFLLLAGCTTTQIANFNNTVAAINADIAAVAPTVAAACSDLQKFAVLIGPYVPTSGKAQQYIAAANGALSNLCAVPPSDIPTTLANVKAAVSAVQDGYNQIKTGS